MPDLNTVLYQNPSAGPASPLLGYWQIDGTELTPQISQSPSANPGLTGYEFIGTGNFDGDATDDVLWQKSLGNGQSELYIWFMNPDNTLRASQGIVQGGPETFKLDDTVPVQRIADFDGDGKDDLLFRVQNSNTFALWKMDGAVADVPQIYELDAEPAGSIFDEDFAIGDFDGNGIQDLFVRNSATGEVLVGLLDANLDLIPEGNPNGPNQSGPLRLDGAIYNLPGNWEILGVTDLNVAGAPGAVLDNKDDIVLRNTQNGQVIGWLMNGSSIQAWDFLGAPVTNGFDFEGFGDFNGDGNGDLLWRSKAPDRTTLGMWLTSATTDGVAVTGAGFVSLSGTTSPYALPNRWEILGFQNVGDTPKFADFNDDGNADIYLHNTATGEAIVWSMDGTVIDSWGFVEFNGNLNPAPAGWQPIGLLSTNTEVTPASGLLGEYYNTVNFNGPVVLSQIDSTVNFNWGLGSPAPSVNSDNFSVRWSGQIQPLYSEEYTFYTTIDDGVSLIVDGQELTFDNSTDQPATEFSGTVTLQAGQKYNIVMEYFEAAGEASAVLEWSSPTQNREVIPASQLFPEMAKQTIDDLKVYVAPGFGGGNPVDLADWFESVSLWIDQNGDGNLSTNEIVSSGNFNAASNSISNTNITYAKTGTTYTFGSSIGVEIWEVNFGDLGLSLPSLSQFNFGVQGIGREIPVEASIDFYPWFMVGANAALSGYGAKAFTDDLYLQFEPDGSFALAIDSNGNGWNKSSDILVQVFDENGALLTDRGLPATITPQNLIRWVAPDTLEIDTTPDSILGDDFTVGPA